MYRERASDSAIGGRLAMKPPVTSVPQFTLWRLMNSANATGTVFEA